MGQGKRLKELLDYNNISVKDFASNINIAPTTLYSIIKRDTSVKEKYLTSIANYLKVDENVLQIFLTTNLSISMLYRMHYITSENFSEFFSDFLNNHSEGNGFEDILSDPENLPENLKAKIKPFPRSNEEFKGIFEEADNEIAHTSIPSNYKKLNAEGRKEAVKRIKELTYIDEYVKKD